MRYYSDYERVIVIDLPFLIKKSAKLDLYSLQSLVYSNYIVLL